MRKDRHVAIWVCGFITGALLMVVDELISLSLYCGLRCDYAFPFIGPLSIWNAWALIFVSIFASVFATLLIFNGNKS
jgi:hypothetical protein